MRATLKGKSEGPLIALRADMDALSVREETGLPFASQNEGVMHACGHDMILAAALILQKLWQKEQRMQKISGQAPVLFEPAEEIG